MNKETLAGKWHELKGNVKQKWGKLTDNDITQINGKREELLGKLESRYGFAKEKAEKEIADFEKACGCSSEMRQDKNKEAFASKGMHNAKTPHTPGASDRTSSDRSQDRMQKDRTQERGQKNKEERR